MPNCISIKPRKLNYIMNPLISLRLTHNLIQLRVSSCCFIYNLFAIILYRIKVSYSLLIDPLLLSNLLYKSNHRHIFFKCSTTFFSEVKMNCCPTILYSQSTALKSRKVHLHIKNMVWYYIFEKAFCNSIALSSMNY